jgi:hypothetical protein
MLLLPTAVGSQPSSARKRATLCRMDGLGTYSTQGTWIRAVRMLRQWTVCAYPRPVAPLRNLGIWQGDDSTFHHQHVTMVPQRPRVWDFGIRDDSPRAGIAAACETAHGPTIDTGECTVLHTTRVLLAEDVRKT